MCVFNSKILTMKEQPTPEEKMEPDTHRQKNGDAPHSTENLSKGPEAAPSKSANTHSEELLKKKS